MTEIPFKVTCEKPTISFLFGKIHEFFGFEVLRMQDRFPDAVLRKNNVNFRTELEFKSSNFKLHKHPINKCDLIICWTHDWEDCPLKIIELNKYFIENPNKELQANIEREMSDIEITKRLMKKRPNRTIENIDKQIGILKKVKRELKKETKIKEDPIKEKQEFKNIIKGPEVKANDKMISYYCALTNNSISIERDFFNECMSLMKEERSVVLSLLQKNKDRWKIF